MDDGRGYDPTRKDGYDIRDCLTAFSTIEERKQAFELLLAEKESPIPLEWSAPTGLTVARHPESFEGCLPCSSWRELVAVVRRPVKWIEGLDRAMSVMLASVISTETLGDPIWVKTMGPASCGKTTLCEMLAPAKRYVMSLSSFTGFHSGYKTDRYGEEDHSLITQVKGKTMITKDGDPILKLPNRSQVLAEARDVYDGASRSFYRHGLNRAYEGIRLSWILCGTGSLRELDHSELGARFLDCVIMEDIPPDLEDDLCMRAINDAWRDVAIASNGKAETTVSADMALAQQTCGGYVMFLRKNAVDLIESVSATDEDRWRMRHCGQFVAFARARQSSKQREVVEREMAPRLCKQLTRMMRCLGAVLNKSTADDEVMRRVQRVAYDTARGQTLRIIQLLRQNPGGVSSGYVKNALIHFEEGEVNKYMSFLRDIGVVRLNVERVGQGVMNKKWVLTDRIAFLADEVLGHV